jgi:hypothetical protein
MRIVELQVLALCCAAGIEVDSRTVRVRHANVYVTYCGECMCMHVEQAAVRVVADWTEYPERALPQSVAQSLVSTVCYSSY